MNKKIKISAFAIISIIGAHHSYWAYQESKFSSLMLANIEAISQTAECGITCSPVNAKEGDCMVEVEKDGYAIPECKWCGDPNMYCDI